MTDYPVPPEAIEAALPIGFEGTGILAGCGEGECDGCIDNCREMLTAAWPHHPAVAALERVKAIHVISPPMGQTEFWCRADGRTWPCPTLRAIEGGEKR